MKLYNTSHTTISTAAVGNTATQMKIENKEEVVERAVVKKRDPAVKKAPVVQIKEAPVVLKKAPAPTPKKEPRPKSVEGAMPVPRPLRDSVVKAKKAEEESLYEDTPKYANFSPDRL